MPMTVGQVWAAVMAARAAAVRWCWSAASRGDRCLCAVETSYEGVAFAALHMRCVFVRWVRCIHVHSGASVKRNFSFTRR